jgi:hypothetical protein
MRVVNHTARTVAVIVFIAAIAVVAIYCAQRRTVARGAVIAEQLRKANRAVAEIECQPTIPIGVDGARFPCRATLRNGDRKTMVFQLDRDGNIKVVDPGKTDYAPRDFGPPPPPPPYQ